jgi:hypothetical protein
MPIKIALEKENNVIKVPHRPLGSRKILTKKNEIRFAQIKRMKGMGKPGIMETNF